MTTRYAPVQGDRPEDLPAGQVPWAIHALAAREYNRHHNQSAERLAERQGFSWVELIACLRGDYTEAGCRKVAEDLAQLRG